MTILRQKIQD